MSIVYNHDRDEPPRKQIFDRNSVEMLNTMMQSVVTGGHRQSGATRLHLFVGKTGTSSNYRDAWFMGITGQYVAGVWLGNDDFTPMARVTGGSFPAQTWHNFMVLAHDTDNIPADSRASPCIRSKSPNRRGSPALTAPAIRRQCRSAPAPSPESVKDMSDRDKRRFSRSSAPC